MFYVPGKLELFFCRGSERFSDPEIGTGSDLLFTRKRRGTERFFMGRKNYNVTKTDFELWKRVLPKSRFYRFPELNHIFCVTEGEPSIADFMEKADFSTEALQAIADFIKTTN